MRPFPDVVRIEPTGACNLRCQHCPTGLFGSGRGAMRYQTFVRYMLALPIVPRVLVLYHGGEPLLNRDLPRMIAYAKGAGVGSVVLNTNGMLLGRGALPGLDEVRVSIDGGSEDEFAELRVGADLVRIADNVRRFHAQHPKTRIVIYNVRIGSNGQTPGFVFQQFMGVPVTFRNERQRYWAALDGRGLEPTNTNYCSNLAETFTIMSTGEVVMCCEDITGSEIIGSLERETPLEIWRAMEARRDAFTRREYPQLCQHCHFVTGNYV
jgi:hypothetical protein